MNNMKRLLLLLVFLLPFVCTAQEEVLVLKGRVTSGGKGVPYATLQLMGTSVGVSCNDAGEYELKVPTGHETDTVVVRSVGFEQAEITVGELRRKGRLVLKPHLIVLKEVTVNEYKSARHLLDEAIARIADNCHSRVAYSTFFVRDWRVVDDEMYLFDEAVMRVKRVGYSHYSDKYGYRFDKEQREMPNDYKTLLKHRLLVYDRNLLVKKIGRKNGADEMLEYADNEMFYDPLYAPQAAYSLAKRMLKLHKFEPIMVFEDNGELYYRVCSTGPGRVNKSSVRYEYIIRKRDLAIVQHTASLRPEGRRPPNEDWVNVGFNRLTYDVDSSSWSYDVREGSYTLTHYYNKKEFHLGVYKQGKESRTQQWKSCIDWTLTDFAFETDSVVGDTIAVRPQTLYGAYGESYYNSDYWGHYNSIVIDTMPLRLLEEKLKKNIKQ